MSLENEAMVLYGLVLALTVVVVVQGFRIKRLEKRVFDKDIL